MKVTDKITITNEDNMELMARYPDNYFDLAIVDPPYGIGISKNPVRQMHEKKQWDNNIPDKKYFDELFRVSKNQIIWGGNYFDLPPTQGFFIWDKKQPHDFSLAMCEMAWSSFQKPAKMWTLSVLKEGNKIHPTQKPVQLYEWLLMNNAQQGDKILDTHLGGGSIAIACHKLGYDLTACEIDTQYFDASIKRIKQQTAQTTIFDLGA
jgi:site-specific DNA-methyltransferase (adenine-specific)